MYFVPETQDEAHLTLDAGNPIPDSKIGSGKVTLSAKKLALRVGFSSELVEDAVIPVLNIYREQAVRAIADAIDNVLLNGDTTAGATGNINSDAARPAKTAKYLALNGLRRLPLVDKAENAVNMNGAPTLAKMRQARFRMSSKYAARPSDLAWIVDSGTYAAQLNLSEFLTMDKAGPLADGADRSDRLRGWDSRFRVSRDVADRSRRQSGAAARTTRGKPSASIGPAGMSATGARSRSA